MPVLSKDRPWFNLKQNTTVAIVSNWDSGTVAGHSLEGTTQDRITVDGNWIRRIQEYNFENSGDPPVFRVVRDAWNKEYCYMCGLWMNADPETNLVHVILSGDDDAFDFKVNKFDSEVTLRCNRRDN